MDFHHHRRQKEHGINTIQGNLENARGLSPAHVGILALLAYATRLRALPLPGRRVSARHNVLHFGRHCRSRWRSHIDLKRTMASLSPSHG